MGGGGWGGGKIDKDRTHLPQDERRLSAILLIHGGALILHCGMQQRKRDIALVEKAFRYIALSLSISLCTFTINTSSRDNGFPFYHFPKSITLSFKRHAQNSMRRRSWSVLPFASTTKLFLWQIHGALSSPSVSVIWGNPDVPSRCRCNGISWPFNQHKRRHRNAFVDRIS